MRPASSSRSRRLRLRAPRADRADVEGVARQRGGQRGHVEPLLVREHDDRGVGVGGQLVRPGDRQLVGARQALARDERGPRVDHLGAPAERLGGAAELLGGVDAADDEQARRRPEHLGEDADAVQLEHAARARRHLRVDPLAGALALEHRHRHGRLLRQLALEGLDEDVDLAAAGEADRPGLLVGDPVGQQPRRAVGEHLGRGDGDVALDAAAGDGAVELAALGDGELRADRPRGRAARGHDGRQRDAVAPRPPALDRLGELAHAPRVPGTCALLALVRPPGRRRPPRAAGRAGRSPDRGSRAGRAACR